MSVDPIRSPPRRRDRLLPPILESPMPDDPEPQQKSSTDFEICCQIGVSSSENANLPRRTPTDRCSHPPSICQSCLERYVGHIMDGNGPLMQVPCPDGVCDQTMEHEDIRKSCSASLSV